MYEAFYGLASKPFQLSPDPSFYFGSKQHRRAKAYLDYGVLRSDGFIVITGEIGAGKTTLVRGLLDSLNRSNVVIGNIVTTQLDAEDTLRLVGAAFGVRVKDLPKSEVLMALEAFFVSEASRGKRCLLIVDEAQNLTARAVEELRMLSNFQFGNQSLVQTFLVGQPEFRGILQRPEMEQFRQRIAASCHIGPLDEEDTQRYIEHRLKCAGAADRPSFDADAFTALHRASHGIPRRINTLCDRLLLLGFMHENPHLTAADVEEVVQDLSNESASAPAPAVHGSEINGHASEGDLAVDLDLTRLRSRVAQGGGLDGELGALADGLAGLSLDGQDARLQRIEDSLMRLERINQQTLALLQKLVGAMR
ncbi:XrtA/PEP-CTERM system-associated ATPase [Roseateles chitinivorans]|uniref:XrtA/PEP-CTERM system-associated ATPase n=1 Tax=Roseateles chitinivorans TaxID=2917965 RepID=UPI003D67270C